MMANLTGNALLKQALDTVHIFQQNYIRVHDIVLDQRLGRTVDYKNVLDALRQVSEVLTAVLEVLRNPAGKLDRSKANTAAAYVEKLLDANDRLFAITVKLSRKAEAREKYSFRDYRYDLGEYRKSVREYQMVGQSLNSLYRELA